MRRTAALHILLGLLALTSPAMAQSPSPSPRPEAGTPPGRGGEKVIDLRANRPPAGNSFEALFSAYKKASQKPDAGAAETALREIRRLRIERNIRSLEAPAMARLAEGVAHLQAGRRDEAESAFRDATALDPHLPDAYFGLAQTQFKKGPLGILAGVKETLRGTAARFLTARGSHTLVTVLVPIGFLALFAAASIFALALVLRHGQLLRHDLEEHFGPNRKGMALGVYAVLLLLPLLTFQGFGWLPLWWLALLFVYLGTVERAAGVALLLACVAVGPLSRMVENRVVTQQNPLYRASLVALEAGPDSRAVVALEEAMRASPDDRDLRYLLAAEYKKSGRYEDSATLYRETLRDRPSDAIALNNLGNLEFASGEFQAAIARYKQGIDASPAPAQGATFQYNLSLAHLQRFEYQPAQEARSQADRLDASLIRAYDSQWKYEKGDYAVVDLGLDADEIWSKFEGRPTGVKVKNVAGQGAAGGAGFGPDTLLNRFVAFPLVFLGVVLLIARWRGSKMFTMRCVKCGTPFCRRCHLGTVAGGLCTQCHHLFVVRDGVSGPARNQKLLEVQKEDERRERIFRGLSLLFPGAGHVYAQKTLVGFLFVLVWALILAAALLAGRILPVTETSSLLTRPWGLGVAAFLLLALYVAANRARPDFEILSMPARRSGNTQGGARRRAS